MRPSRFDLAVWAVLGALVLSLAGLTAAGAAAGVRVVATAPADGGIAGGRAAVSLTFGEPMQPETVEARFRIEPAVEGSLRWQGERLLFVPTQPLQPAVEYTARVEAGAVAASGRTLEGEIVWTFTVRPPYVVYLAPAFGPHELWRRPEGERAGPPERLTDTDGAVIDYALAPDGASIVYTRFNDLGGADLWLLPEGQAAVRLVDCGGDRCTAPAFSPDGRWIAYSREERAVDGSGRPAPPRVWTVAAAGGASAPLFQDSQVLGFSPSWSPDGARLAFFDGNLGAIRVVALDGGAEEILPTQMGLVGSWSPDGARMLFPVMNLGGPQPTVELHAADLAGRAIRRVLGPDSGWGDFSVPVWSPDGAWILIGLQTPGGGPARQAWIMRPDGSEARALLDDPAFSYGGLQWDPAGGTVAFQRFRLNAAEARPEVLVLDLASGVQRLIAEDAWMPGWQP
jgi:TolB protein